MRVWHISDTHCNHEELEIKECDMIIHSGDASNQRNVDYNEKEFGWFVEWFESLDIQYKIYVAGNHDTSVAAGRWKHLPFIYLENESVVIEGYNIFGSPYTPSFGHGWSFNKSRSNLGNIWPNIIPNNVDILITHGPPKGILDTTTRYDHKIETVGCSALAKRVFEVKPSLHLFGHIHDGHGIINHGTRVLTYNSSYKSDKHIVFSNGAVVSDGTGYEITNNGNVFELDLL